MEPLPVRWRPHLHLFVAPNSMIQGEKIAEEAGLFWTLFLSGPHVKLQAMRPISHSECSRHAMSLTKWEQLVNAILTWVRARVWHQTRPECLNSIICKNCTMTKPYSIWGSSDDSARAGIWGYLLFMNTCNDQTEQVYWVPGSPLSYKIWVYEPGILTGWAVQSSSTPWWPIYLLVPLPYFMVTWVLGNSAFIWVSTWWPWLGFWDGIPCRKLNLNIRQALVQFDCFVCIEVSLTSKKIAVGQKEGMKSRRETSLSPSGME